MNMINTVSGEKKNPLTKLSAKGKGKMLIILIGAILGVLLLILGGGDDNADSKDQTLVIENFGEYAKSIEQKIYELCSRVDGVSDVSVAVSFECGFEYVYARDDEKGDFLVIGSGSSESAVRVTERPPVIGGIGIVCKGGGDPTVQNRLINLISAAFGVSSNKIYITECAK